ncbi:MAG: hypothetical protein ACYTFQ_00310 [Planctomycetota bacterium]|jgi:hypothetical protein
MSDETSKIAIHPQAALHPNIILLQVLKQSKDVEAVLIAHKVKGDGNVYVTWSEMDHEELAHLGAMTAKDVSEELAKP